MHTKTYGKFGEYKINIDKLMEFAANIPRVNREIMSLDLSTISITKHSGFSEKRLVKCDIDIPILIDENYGIIDGRHRVLKSILFNKRNIPTRFINNKILKRCIINGRDENRA